MLHDRDHAAGHEACRSHRLAGTRHLGDLDHSPAAAHLDAPARLGCHDIEVPYALADVDEDLHPVAFHCDKGTARGRVGAMSDSSQGPGWWLASDGKWYAPQAPQVPPPPAPAKSGMSGCAVALIVGGIMAVLGVVGVIVLLVLAVGRGVEHINNSVVGVEGRPTSLPRGESGYPGMLEQDHVAGASGTVRLAGYTTTAKGWARTTSQSGAAVICGNVTMQSQERQGQTNDPGDVLEIVGAQNWTLVNPDGSEAAVVAEASDFDALANFAVEGRVGGARQGRVCFVDTGDSGRHVVTWRPRLFNAARGVWLVRI